VRISPRSLRNSVAHAVESHCTTSVPSLNSVISVCSAVDSPMNTGHSAIRRACSSSSFHPRSCAVPASICPRGCGSRPRPNGTLPEIAFPALALFRSGRPFQCAFALRYALLANPASAVPATGLPLAEFFLCNFGHLTRNDLNPSPASARREVSLNCGGH